MNNDTSKTVIVRMFVELEIRLYIDIESIGLMAIYASLKSTAGLLEAYLII